MKTPPEYRDVQADSYNSLKQAVVRPAPVKCLMNFAITQKPWPIFPDDLYKKGTLCENGWTFPFRSVCRRFAVVDSVPGTGCPVVYWAPIKPMLVYWLFFLKNVQSCYVVEVRPTNYYTSTVRLPQIFCGK